MRLTQEQDQRVAHYLNEVRTRLGEVPEQHAHECLARLKAHIGRRLREFGSEAISDHDLATLLRNLGTPEQQAARISDARRGDGRHGDDYGFLAWHDRVWLGVCGGLAQQLGMEPSWMRFLAVFLGLVPPVLPLLLIVYLAAYLVVCFSPQGQSLPRPSRWALARSIGGAIAVIVTLSVGAGMLLVLFRHAYAQLAGRTLIVEGGMGWLFVYKRPMLFWMLLTFTPLSAIAALPVSPDWASTLRKLVHAGIAAYAMALSFGIACVLVAIILGVVNDVAAGGGVELLKPFF